MKCLVGGLLLLLLAPVAWGASSVSDSDQGSQAAQSIYSQTVAPHSGSRQAVHDNLVQPLVSGGTITSSDGKTSFSSSAFQSSNTPLIRVTVWPNPATADVKQILVEQDLTGSGTFGVAATFPASGGTAQMITTVCANGYAQCDTGTFSNCRFRTWDAASSGAISSSVAGVGNSQDEVGTISSLSSCYCFSRACSHNNNSVLSIDSITASVGGGVLAAFLGAKTGMLVTSAQSTGSGVITYYGVASSSVSAGSYNTGSLTPSQIADMPVTSTVDVPQVQSYYKTSGTALDSLASTAKQQQMSTPNSLYNLVATASTHISGNTYSCTNLMTPAVEVAQRTATKTGGVGSMCTGNSVNMVMTQSDPDSFAIGVYGYDSHGVGHLCGGLPPFNVPLNFNATPVDIFDFIQPLTTTGFELTSVTANMSLWGSGCSAGTGSITWNKGDAQNSPMVIKTSVNCGADNEQHPSYSWDFIATFDSQEITTISNPGCQQYEQDTNCKPIQELWDGRPYRLNGLVQGFTMAQVSKDIPGPLRNVHVTSPPERPWFRQDKTFYCNNTGSGYDFTALRQRVKGIQDSSNMPTDSSMTYKDNGVAYNFGVPKKGAQPACSQVCKTKLPASQSPLLSSGLAATNTMTNTGVGTQTSSFFFKDCTANSDSTWTCPVDAAKGETVVTQCGCSSDMGGVIGALTAADEAAKDSICSSH